MHGERLQVLSVSHFPHAPPTFGAQRRIQGLLAALARRHELTAISLIPPDLDRADAERAMRAYCREVVLVPVPSRTGVAKRLLQLRGLASRRSFERLAADSLALRRELKRLLASRRFDVVLLEFPFLAHYRLDSPGAPPPLRILDEHNLEFDLSRQSAGEELGLARRIHNAANWPKLRSEEATAFRTFDGVLFCSEVDRRRAQDVVPSMRSAVVPNAVDVEYFRPVSGPSAPDRATVLFFGAINYFPNVDGLRYLLRAVWPLVERSHPEARLKIIGQHPTPEILAFRSGTVEVLGKVDDVRPHLAAASVTVVPLRIGGGTRFKILEAMASARPVVSTSLGAEGIEAQPGEDLLLGDDPASFAAAVGRVLDEPALAARLGARGRALVEQKYSWEASARRLEHFLAELLAAPKQKNPA